MSTLVQADRFGLTPSDYARADLAEGVSTLTGKVITRPPESMAQVLDLHAGIRFETSRRDWWQAQLTAAFGDDLEAADRFLRTLPLI